MRKQFLIMGFLGTFGCQEDPERAPCKEGFVRAQERWCVFDEAYFPMQSEDSEDVDIETPDQEEGNGSNETDASEYVHESDTPTVKLSLEEIEVAVEDAILLVRWIDPAKLHDAYDNSESYGDESCPSYDEEYFEERGQYHWRDAYKWGGGPFSGYAYSYYYGDYITDNGAYDYDGHAYLRGSARVIDGRGNTDRRRILQLLGAHPLSAWRSHILFEHVGQFPL